MRKWYNKGFLVASALAGAALLLSSTQASAYSHAGVALRDATGAVILADTIDPDGVPGSGDEYKAVPASAPAFSTKESCGTGTCHDYEAIERHSFHAQLGANQYLGWNAWATGNWNSIASKGKPWVQSPGHVGKW